MVDAFATVDELASRLGRDFTSNEEAQVQLLLEDASAYLREDVIGAQVYPQSQSTFKAWPDGSGVVVLPQQPTISVDSVKVAGVAQSFVWRDDHITVGTCEQVDVTFTYGFAAAPAGLRRWAIVLASQALSLVENQLGLTAGGLSSVSIDDFKLAWADAGTESGITLSDRNIALIRSQYGPSGVTVTETRP